MIILVDKEGKAVVTSLIDIALRAGGIKNLAQINMIASAVKEIPTKKKEATTDTDESKPDLPVPKDKDEQPK